MSPCSGLARKIPTELSLRPRQLRIRAEITFALDDYRTNCYVKSFAIFGWTLKDDSLLAEFKTSVD